LKPIFLKKNFVFSLFILLPLLSHAEDLTERIIKTYPGEIPVSQKMILKRIDSGDYVELHHPKWAKGVIQYARNKITELNACLTRKVHQSTIIALPKDNKVSDWFGSRASRFIGKVTDKILNLRKKLKMEFTPQQKINFHNSLGSLIYLYASGLIRDMATQYKMDSFQKACTAACLSNALIRWFMGPRELITCYKTIEEAIEYGKGLCWDQARLTVNLLDIVDVNTKFVNKVMHTFLQFQAEDQQWFAMDPYITEQGAHFHVKNPACIVVGNQKDLKVIHPKKKECISHDLAPDKYVCIGDIFVRTDKHNFLLGRSEEVIIVDLSKDNIYYSILKTNNIKYSQGFGSKKHEATYRKFFKNFFYGITSIKRYHKK
jgi:hypothetical protein